MNSNNSGQILCVCLFFNCPFSKWPAADACRFNNGHFSCYGTSEKLELKTNKSLYRTNTAVSHKNTSSPTSKIQPSHLDLETIHVQTCSPSGKDHAWGFHLSRQLVPETHVKAPLLCLCERREATLHLPTADFS